MMQPGSRVPGLLPPASPRHYRSVCLPIYLFICLPAYLSVCLAVNQSRLMPPSACLSTALSVCPSVRLFCLSVRLSVRLSVSAYLSVYLSLCLPMYLSVRLPICPTVRAVCLSVHARDGAYRAYHTEMPYRDWNHGAACCPVRSVAECGCTMDE